MGQSTRGIGTGIGNVKVVYSTISCIGATVFWTFSCIEATVDWDTPGEVEVSPRVKERGGKAKDEDLEEPAHISIQSGEMIIFIKEYLMELVSTLEQTPKLMENRSP